MRSRNWTSMQSALRRGWVWRPAGFSTLNHDLFVTQVETPSKAFAAPAEAKSRTEACKLRFASAVAWFACGKAFAVGSLNPKALRR